MNELSMSITIAFLFANGLILELTSRSSGFVAWIFQRYHALLGLSQSTTLVM
jgi:hypothetical protein